jgi:ubiquinone/menaquinone biosynthesis C-methylase UbiE
MLSAVYKQFERPDGMAGALAGAIMAHRRSNKARNAWTVALLDLKPSDRVLEIGYGPGLSLMDAARVASTGEVVGLDHSNVMLRQAARRNKHAIASGRVTLLLGELSALKSLKPGFDKAFSVNVAMFWRDRAQALRIIGDVLAPGGLLATTHQPRHAGSTAADADRFADAFSRALADAGFTHIRVERLLLKPVPAVCILSTRGE